MILITSGAYIASEFISEMGRIPSAFVPVGNRRLFSYQFDFLSAIEDDRYISIPEDYEVSKFDREYIEGQKVKILRVPNNLSLGESLIYCWNATGKVYHNLKVLHGDTLFRDLDLEIDDTISVDLNSGFYERATVSVNKGRIIDIANDWAGEDDYVVSGYFNFASPHVLAKGIIKSKHNFIDGLAYYARKVGLKPIHSKKWLDFGHVNSFFQSRSEMTTERAFNQIQIDSGFVKKTSANFTKINAESNWFEKIPNEVKLYCPKLIHKETDDPASCSYTLEYLYKLPLSDLFVYGELTAAGWRSIFRACKEVIDKFSSYSAPNSGKLKSSHSYIAKTNQRLSDFSKQNVFDTDRKIQLENSPPLSLMDLAHVTNKYIDSTRTDFCISHGDFCFSNILFDFRSQRIYTIDPRGLDHFNKISLYGDQRYDVSKLYHSIIGLYDMIIAERYTLQPMSEKGDAPKIEFPLTSQQKRVQSVFVDFFLNDVPEREIEILAITIHLFLSMLPLHYDNRKRQYAMIANAYRLYSQLLEKIS